MSLRFTSAAVVCLVALSAVPALAQNNTAGVVFGSSLTFPKLDPSDPQITFGRNGGLVAGGYGLIQVVRMVAIQPEVVWAQKHFSVKDSGGTDVEKWDWIDVPILVRIKPALGSRGFYGLVGPGFSFLVKAVEDSGSSEPDVKNRLQDNDVSIIVGGGYSGGKIAADIRYEFGTKDVSKGITDTGHTLKMNTLIIVFRWHP